MQKKKIKPRMIMLAAILMSLFIQTGSPAYANTDRSGIIINAGKITPSEITITVKSGENRSCSAIVSEGSKDKDFKKIIAFKRHSSIRRGTSTSFTFTKLDRNTRYYFRARTERVEDGIKNSSEYSYASYRTGRTEQAKETVHTRKKTQKKKATQKPVSTRREAAQKPAAKGKWTQADTDVITDKLKSDKSFTYTFHGTPAGEKVSKHLADISFDYPQYAGRFKRNICYESDQVKIKYRYNAAAAARCEEMEAVINTIAKGANRKATVRQKVAYINDKLCDICEYDWDTYRKTDKADKAAYTAYGCLVKGKAVCAGYAEAFRAIAVQCGIRNKYAEVTGIHRWNLVKLGRKWYHVDVTWNDSGGDRSKYLFKEKHPKVTPNRTQ